MNNIVMQEGDTALIKASKCGKQSIVKFLLKQGAAINVQDEVRNHHIVYMFIVYYVITYFL